MHGFKLTSRPTTPCRSRFVGLRFKPATSSCLASSASSSPALTMTHAGVSIRFAPGIGVLLEEDARGLLSLSGPTGAGAAGASVDRAEVRAGADGPPNVPIGPEFELAAGSCMGSDDGPAWTLLSSTAYVPFSGAVEMRTMTLSGGAGSTSPVTSQFYAIPLGVLGGVGSVLRASSSTQHNISRL